MPLRLAGLARSLAGRWREVSLMDVVTGLAEALPSGLYTGAGIEKYIREILADATSPTTSGCSSPSCT